MRAPSALIYLFAVATSFLWDFSSLQPVRAQVKQVPNSQSLVEAVKVSGHVRFKTPTDPNWKTAHEGLQLSAGDLLFVDSESELKLRYIKEKATITIAAESIFEVENRLPTSTKQKRAFGQVKYQGKLVPREINKDGTFTKIQMAPADDQNAQGSPQANPEEESGLTVERRVTPVTFVNPPGDLIVVAREFPTQIAVTLKIADSSVRFFGYLWEIGMDPAPIWTGTGKEYFNDIQIAKEGKYVFQAMSEDDTFSSLPLKIEAVKVEKWIKTKAFQEESWIGNRTLLFK